MERAETTEARARLRAARSVHDGARANDPAPVPTVATPRRGGRGYVLSYGDARVCAARGCTTHLSRYNDRNVCATHDGLGKEPAIP